MNKTVAIAAAATVLLGLAACSKGEEANTAANTTENVVEENLTSENVTDVTNETANAVDNAANATENAAEATDANASNEAAK